jgi:riboflavin kinase/FMN adenylyltransferase
VSEDTTNERDGNAARDHRSGAPYVVAIGNFDGVHAGHRVLLREAAAQARARGISARVLTFDPHPAAVLGRSAPRLLTSFERRAELVRRVDPNLTLVAERFDETLAAMSPAEFAAGVLVAKHGATAILVGQNFRFGKDRAGNVRALEELGKQLGFATTAVALASDAQGALSSTRVRDAIAQGDLQDAAALLGRPHMLSGRVVHGDHRGRTIGFPTCNLDGVSEALPPYGVYSVLVDRESERPGTFRALAGGVANIGLRPTIASGALEPRIEVHLFDFEGDLYGVRLRAHLVDWIRPERRFASLEELRAQIASDAAHAERTLAPLVPSPDADGAWA